MRHRLLAALAGLIIAGCTAQQPQNLSYSPVAGEALPPPVAASAAPVPPPAQPQVPAPAAAVTSSAETAAGFPPAPACGNGPGEVACTAPERRTCRTVGAVTTCDVPPDPSADATLYTN